jgi:hypothetical protein
MVPFHWTPIAPLIVLRLAGNIQLLPTICKFQIRTIEVHIFPQYPLIYSQYRTWNP